MCENVNAPIMFMVVHSVLDKMGSDHFFFTLLPVLHSVRLSFNALSATTHCKLNEVINIIARNLCRN